MGEDLKRETEGLRMTMAAQAAHRLVGRPREIVYTEPEETLTFAFTLAGE